MVKALIERIAGPVVIDNLTLGGPVRIAVGLDLGVAIIVTRVTLVKDAVGLRCAAGER